MKDKEFMMLALELAKKGEGFVNPNPLVGAIVVKNEAIIGQGYHERYGSNHAERNALLHCTQSPQDATLYVTLEPCCHYGKTPPCTQIIIQSGIKKVVIGSHDPNPLVGGNGIKQLREHGIEVIEGVLEEKCNKLNAPFFHYIKTKMPYVVMKYAMTMDGKIACYTGDSKWISNESSRQSVHRDRHRYQAIMVGIQTVLSDNPMLTCRIKGGQNPQRIICDTKLLTPFDSNIVTSAKDIPTLIATASTDPKLHQKYRDKGCDILLIKKKEGHLDLKELMQKLGEKNICSILLEGGATLNWSALQEGLVHKVQTYIAPKLFGGIHAKAPIGGMGVKSPKEAFFLTPPLVTYLDGDILLESEVISTCSQDLLKKSVK